MTKSNKRKENNLINIFPLYIFINYVYTYKKNKKNL